MCGHYIVLGPVSLSRDAKMAAMTGRMRRQVHFLDKA